MTERRAFLSFSFLPPSLSLLLPELSSSCWSKLAPLDSQSFHLTSQFYRYSPMAPSSLSDPPILHQSSRASTLPSSDPSSSSFIGAQLQSSTSKKSSSRETLPVAKDSQVETVKKGSLEGSKGGGPREAKEERGARMRDADEGMSLPMNSEYYLQLSISFFRSIVRR